MSAQSTSFHPLHIFIIEDHPDTLKVLALHLKRLGHDVQTAFTFNEAMEKVPRSGLDVLISDMGLPDGDGWTLLKALQLATPVYAIAMSGYGSEADRARSHEVGYRVHLKKPFEISLLHDALQAARDFKGETSSAMD